LDVGLTEEQLLLRDSAERLGRSLGTTRSPRRWALEEAAWDELVRAGFTAVRAPDEPGFPRAHGVEVALVAEALARCLVNAPYVGSIVASELLALTEAGAQVAVEVETGARRIVPLLDSSLTRFAHRGEDSVAWDAAGAESGLVVDGDQVLVVGLEDAVLPAVDLTRRLVAVPASAEGDPVGTIAAECLARTEALMLVLVTADLVGTADGARESATEYAKARRQFGRPIGSFQAVQHRLAEDLVSVQSSRSIMWFAAWTLDALSASESLLAARTAKAWAARACIDVCESAIQVRAGVGMTWEDLSHLYLRRAQMDRLVLGDERFQFDRIADARLGGR